MSESTGIVHAPDGLLPHQLSFINAVFESTNRRVVVLSAQAGLGKTNTLVALAQTLFSIKSSARLLVLGPTPVAKAYRDRLLSAGAPAVFVDGFRFREIRNAIVHGTAWPVETSIMMSIDDLASHDEIAMTLTFVEWDMVIVDDVDNIAGLSREILSGMSHRTERLVIGTREQELPAGVFGDDDVSVIHWRPDEVVDQAGRPLAGPQPVVKEVRYSLTEEECRLYRSVEQLCRTLESASSQESARFGAVLGRQLLSSPATLEAGLRAWTLQVVAMSQDGVDEEQIDPAALNAFAKQIPRDEIAVIAGLAARDIAALESLESDSKFEKLIELLDAVPPADQPVRRRVCIVTCYAATLYYLSAALDDCGRRALLLHGGMDAESLRRTLDTFNNEGGVLIATRAILKRVELPGIRDLVIYEPPEGIAEAQGLVSRFDQLRRRTALRVHMLRPDNWAHASFDSGLAAVRESVARSRVL